MYLEVFEFPGGDFDVVVRDVNQQITVPHANATVAAHDFGAFLVERGGFDFICEGAAVAGCFVGLHWCFGIGHVGMVLFDKKLRLTRLCQGSLAVYHESQWAHS